MTNHASAEPTLENWKAEALKSRERIAELEASVKGVQAGGRNIQREMIAKLNELESTLSETRQRLEESQKLVQLHNENYKQQYQQKWEIIQAAEKKEKEFEAKLKAQNKVVEAARAAEHFFAFPEEYDGPDQAELHMNLTDSLTALDKPSGGV